MTAVADDDTVTITDRMRAAGISQERIDMHLQRGGVHVDGVPVTDPNHPAAPPAKWVVMPA